MQPAVWKILLLLLSTASLAGAVTFTEDFSTNPLANGWQIFGNASLFNWNPTNQNLEVIWDSSQTNSYFYHRLDTILTDNDSFQLGFDLGLLDAVIGTNPDQPYTFEVAVGFLNLDNATRTNFFRGSGRNAAYGPDNLVEFDFFPAFDIFQPTISQVIVSTNNAWLYNDNLLDLPPGELFHIAMAYDGGTETLTTVTTSGGVQYGPTQLIKVPDGFDFRANAVSINCYSEQHSDGSILAHGTIGNIIVTEPPAPVQNLSGGFAQGVWQAQFLGRSNWFYTLERTADFLAWTNVACASLVDDENLFLQDTNPPSGMAFYRVEAERP
jgi:hypothetical protein